MLSSFARLPNIAKTYYLVKKYSRFASIEQIAARSQSVVHI